MLLFFLLSHLRYSYSFIVYCFSYIPFELLLLVQWEDEDGCVSCAAASLRLLKYFHKNRCIKCLLDCGNHAPMLAADRAQVGCWVIISETSVSDNSFCWMGRLWDATCDNRIWLLAEFALKQYESKDLVTLCYYLLTTHTMVRVMTLFFLPFNHPASSPHLAKRF